jgi:hypothetical protein
MRITIKIKRNGAEQILQGKIKLPYEEKKHWMQPMQQKDVKDSLVKRLKLKILYQIPI